MTLLEPLEIGRLALTMAVGLIGARLAGALRLPAAPLIGSLLAVGSLNLLGAPLAHLGAEYRYAAQVLIGATVASTISPAIAAQMLRLVGPAAIGMAVLIILGVLAGWAVHLATGLQLASSLFAGAPGGVVEMTLAAGDVGGDVELVAAVQFVRLLLVATLVPVLMRWAFRKRA